MTVKWSNWVLYMDIENGWFAYGCLDHYVTGEIIMDKWMNIYTALSHLQFAKAATVYNNNNTVLLIIIIIHK